MLRVGEPIHGGTGGVDDSPQAREVFRLADTDNSMELTYSEFQHFFTGLDTDSDGNVTSTEFMSLWVNDSLGDVTQGVRLFLNLDVNKDILINHIDMPYIFKFFDRNVNSLITEGEFVIQWVKIST